jgi:hypothetical protein
MKNRLELAAEKPVVCVIDSSSLTWVRLVWQRIECMLEHMSPV